MHNWRPVEIKDLPDEVVEFLPFYEMIEITGEWPADLTWAAVTLNSKGEGSLLLSQRPISVMSIIYRMWTATRARQCMVAKMWIRRWTLPRHLTTFPQPSRWFFYAGPKSSESSYDFDTVLKRRFNVKSYLGEPLRATNGIMQGETLSCMVLHGLVSVLSNYLDKNAGKLENQ